MEGLAATVGVPVTHGPEDLPMRHNRPLMKAGRILAHDESTVLPLAP